MGNDERALIELGRAIGAKQDEALGAEDLAASRARLVAAASRPASHRALAVLALAAALAMAVLFGVRARRPALSFAVEGVAGRADAWIAAPAGTTLPLRFSDGTVVALDPTARARVTDLDRRGARVVLERGALSAAVVHAEDTRWRVTAGPFEVHVTGTRFEVGFQPDEETFRLSLREGSVEVSGPVVGERRRVTAGETLVVSCRDHHLALTSGEPLTAASSAATVAPAAPPSIAPAPSATASEALAPITSPATTASMPASAAIPAARARYRDLAAQGRYADALRAAEEEGFPALCARASATDLMDLADAARLAGNAGRAAEALTALRRRFSGSPAAATAAFVLGRLSFERRSAYAEAAEWFGTYLREQPGGALAPEALGRLMECHDRSGDADRARAAAERYLGSYPNGAHAETARRLVGQ
ncbi:hypothetical protein A7982_13485 [Minicystis rosea]|nr:hypothetical protein A7982_13485 [Minicystis rosea]